jgi:hypothetical protein
MRRGEYLEIGGVPICIHHEKNNNALKVSGFEHREAQLEFPASICN